MPYLEIGAAEREERDRKREERDERERDRERDRELELTRKLYFTRIVVEVESKTCNN